MYGFWLKKDITKGLFIFVASSSAGRLGLSPLLMSIRLALSSTRQVETPKSGGRFYAHMITRTKLQWRNVIVYILGYKPCSYAIKFYEKWEEWHLTAMDKVELDGRLVITILNQRFKRSLGFEISDKTCWNDRCKKRALIIWFACLASIHSWHFTESNIM